jgi:poly(A) polymerase
VGGTVRDLLLDRATGELDFDLTTDALPEQTKKLVSGWADAVWTAGERFGTISLQKDGRTYEITTHRAEAYSPDSRKPDVQFSLDIGTDLSRRDFTVNAMALELTADAPELVDPFGGVADLLSKTLRTPLSPSESFSDDPLRMMRAARFMSALQLQPVPELVDAVRAMHERLTIISAERVRNELDRLMVTDHPSSVCGSWSTQALPNTSSLNCRR